VLSKQKNRFYIGLHDLQKKGLLTPLKNCVIRIGNRSEVHDLFKDRANFSAHFQLIASVIPIAFQAFLQNMVGERLQNLEVRKHLFFSERERLFESHIGSL
jgi:hypothetical protein